MASLDEKMSMVAEQVLKRPLSEEEQLEMYKISDAMGMANVQSFLHQLLVFKLYEDTLRRQFKDLASFEDRLNERFQEMAALETRIDQTLEEAVSRLLSEGAVRIGGDMSEEIASQTKGIFSAVGAYHGIRGQVLVACIVCASAALGYIFGLRDILSALSPGGAIEALLFMPAGWCFFLCGLAYTFFWVGDRWFKIRRRKWFKALLGLQVLTWLWLLGSLL